jgi:hypothetical protein
MKAWRVDQRLNNAMLTTVTGLPVLVVFPMQRIETLVQKAPDRSFSWRNASMKEIPME